VSDKLRVMGLTRAGTFSRSARQQAVRALQRIGEVTLRPARIAAEQRDASIASTIGAVETAVNELRMESSALRHQIEALHAQLTSQQDDVHARLDRIRAIASSALDDISALRQRLADARSGKEYELAYDDPEPLVTVRVATFNLAETLVERALASVLAQTYERFEVIVVGDSCTDDTEHRIRQLNDHRIAFVNLPYRGPYPEPPQRWLVAGSPGMNVGAAEAAGRWIAPLDDDDEFTSDHIEVLLAAARRERSEVAYGDILQLNDDDSSTVLSSYPPQLGQFGFQAALYNASLRFFTYNTKSWLLDEPGDWNLARRMLEAGVRFHRVDRVVTRYYPSTLQGDKRE
jgi:hypothetical protein